MIILVEDDAVLRQTIAAALVQGGHEVQAAGSAAEALPLLRQKPALALLDLNLPDGSGFDLCQLVKDQGDIPVIFLTARDGEADIVKGLDMGGDDYITKPFRLPVLLSRIRAVMRRNAAPKVDGDILTCGDIRLIKSRTEVFVAGRPVVLRTLEYRLLLLLLENKYMTLTRTRLLERLWDDKGNFVYDNTLTVTMKRLREKVEDNPAAPRYLKTVRGIGYKVVDDNGNEGV